LYIFDTVI